MELPKPEVVSCFFEKSFEPHLPAMELCWDPDAPGVAERTWYLPDSVCLKGPAPYRFGITINRYGTDTYRVRVLWNRLCLTWDELNRVQIMTSSLALVLSALGTDLWYLLNQPIEDSTTPSLQFA
jgi:hypothetical protein